MFEVINYKAVTASVAFAVGMAALTGCSSGESSPKPTSDCIAVGFGSDKGGPGLIEVNVYPILKDQAVAARVSGEVIGGNDKGAAIRDNSAAFAGTGEFLFSWDDTTKAIQTAEVTVAAEVAGKAQLQICPVTTLHLDPTNLYLSPTYK